MERRTTAIGRVMVPRAEFTFEHHVKAAEGDVDRLRERGIDVDLYAGSEFLAHPADIEEADIPFTMYPIHGEWYYGIDDVEQLERLREIIANPVVYV